MARNKVNFDELIGEAVKSMSLQSGMSEDDIKKAMLVYLTPSTAKVRELMWLYKDLMRNKYKTGAGIVAFGSIIKQFQQLARVFSMDQCKALLFAHFEWRGVNGSSDREYEYLMSTGFPLPLLLKNAPLYEAYLKNTIGEAFYTEGLSAIVLQWEELLRSKLNA
jgi:hypothetical protein